ncbi:MAG TPA: BON domain-containing protein [Gemmataceae bacterium]|nr:BON domain-containing protein [Gemmataceae bacterium]
MRDRGKWRRWRGLACLGLLLAGCDGQDADRLAKIGHKVLDRLQAQTSGDPGRLPDSLQSIRGGFGEFALDAKVSARLRWDKNLEGTSIQAAALGGGVVKLTGVVPTFEARQHAVHLARTTTGVSNVVDELSVENGR